MVGYKWNDMINKIDRFIMKDKRDQYRNRMAKKPLFSFNFDF